MHQDCTLQLGNTMENVSRKELVAGSVSHGLIDCTSWNANDISIFKPRIGLLEYSSSTKSSYRGALSFKGT